MGISPADVIAKAKAVLKTAPPGILPITEGQILDAGMNNNKAELRRLRGILQSNMETFAAARHRSGTANSMRLLTIVNDFLEG